MEGARGRIISLRRLAGVWNSLSEVVVEAETLDSLKKVPRSTPIRT